MKRLLTTFALAFCYLTLPAMAQQTVTLGWDRHPDPSVTGFNIYYGIAPRIYTNQVDVGSVTNAAISNLVSGVRYYFTATAYTANRTESDFSNEVSYTVKPQPPVLKTPFVALSWSGPWTVWESTNLLAWSRLMDTPFNAASFPIGAESQKYFRVSTTDTNLNVRIEASPQL